MHDAGYGNNLERRHYRQFDQDVANDIPKQRNCVIGELLPFCALPIGTSNSALTYSGLQELGNYGNVQGGDLANPQGKPAMRLHSLTAARFTR